MSFDEPQKLSQSQTPSTSFAGTIAREVDLADRARDSIYSLSINLCRSISNLIRCLCGLGILLLVYLASSQSALCISVDQLLHNLDSSGRTAWLSSEDLTRLVDYEDTTHGSLWPLLQPNGRDECLRRIAQQCVGELLLRLEGGVRLGAVV
jgi:hypothetical protein